MRLSFLSAFIAAAIVSTASPAQAQLFPGFQGPWNVHAQGHKARRYSAPVPPRGARCGYYLRHKLGHSDPTLNLAQAWLRKFPRTSASAGAVVVWTRGGNRGHVAKLVRLTGPCRGIVHDNAGTYERNICRNVLGYVRA
jgi:hypothetical protein